MFLDLPRKSYPNARFQHACKIMTKCIRKPSKLHLNPSNNNLLHAKRLQNPSKIHLEFIPEPPQDEVPRKQPSSFFSSVSFEGAKDVSHTPRGIAFRSEGSRVVLTYSTHTCSDFYWYHGKEKRQLCNRPYAAVREIDAGAPYSLPCA